jgi:hypothetical protein
MVFASFQDIGQQEEKKEDSINVLNGKRRLLAICMRHSFEIPSRP